MISKISLEHLALSITLQGKLIEIEKELAKQDGWLMRSIQLFSS